MEPLLWSFEEVSRFAKHQDASLQRWALERLVKLFPEQAGDILLTMLDDKGAFIASKALDFLGKSGDADKHGPTLLEHLKRADGEHFGRLAVALAKLGYRPAFPVIKAYVNQDDKPVSLNEYWSIVRALAEFGDEARQTLWALLEEQPKEGAALTMEALLQTAQPEDFPRLVEYYRSLPLNNGPLSAFGLVRHPLTAFATAVQVDNLVSAMEGSVDEGFWTMLERGEEELSADIRLSEASWRELGPAFDRNYLGVLDILVREANEFIDDRADDIAGWLAAWEAGDRPVGYCQRTLYTKLFLETLAEQPMATLTPRRQESILGLAMLAQLSVDTDDQAALDAAPDKAEALLTILTKPQERVLPDIVERVVDLGPEIVPRLINILDPDDYSWASIRAARALEQLARRHPGSCDVAVPQLLACIHDDQGDILLEDTSSALEAIGPAAVELINQVLRNTDDTSREIYLSGVLGEIPVESATQIILAKLRAGQAIEEGELTSLGDIGSASAIEPLYQLWKPDDKTLAEQLLILCELNGVNKPELPEWRHLVSDEDERLADVMRGDITEKLESGDFLSTLKKLAASPSLLQRSWQLERPSAKPQLNPTKRAGTKATKKRSVQGKRTKGRKKKHRRG